MPATNESAPARSGNSSEGNDSTPTITKESVVTIVQQDGQKVQLRSKSKTRPRTKALCNDCGSVRDVALTFQDQRKLRCTHCSATTVHSVIFAAASTVGDWKESSNRRTDAAFAKFREAGFEIELRDDEGFVDHDVCIRHRLTHFDEAAGWSLELRPGLEGIHLQKALDWAWEQYEHHEDRRWFVYLSDHLGPNRCLARRVR